MISEKPYPLPTFGALCKLSARYPFSLCLLLICFGLNSHANNFSSSSNNRKLHIDTLITAKPETMPQYPGGLQRFYKFISDNYRYSSAALEAAVKGRVVVSFVVDKDGGLTDFKVVRDLGFDTGQQLITVLQKCGKWMPGYQNGRPVRVQYTLPINLEAPKSADKKED